MSTINPEPGEIFWIDDVQTRLRYVGRTVSGDLVMEHMDEPFLRTGLVTITTRHARDHMVPWTEKSIDLAEGQLWKRSRHDYAERSARVLSVVHYGGENFVIYEEFYSHSPNPKMKKEIDFRRVYGKFIPQDEEKSSDDLGD